jgi:hypothetical protein
MYFLDEVLGFLLIFKNDFREFQIVNIFTEEIIHKSTEYFFSEIFFVNESKKLIFGNN